MIEGVRQLFRANPLIVPDRRCTGVTTKRDDASKIITLGIKCPRRIDGDSSGLWHDEFVPLGDGWFEGYIEFRRKVCQFNGTHF